MATALGTIGIVIFIACVISLAAGVTYAVVRLTPTDSQKQRTQPDSSA